MVNTCLLARANLNFFSESFNSKVWYLSVIAAFWYILAVAKTGCTIWCNSALMVKSHMPLLISIDTDVYGLINAWHNSWKMAGVTEAGKYFYWVSFQPVWMSQLWLINLCYRWTDSRSIWAIRKVWQKNLFYRSRAETWGFKWIKPRANLWGGVVPILCSVYCEVYRWWWYQVSPLFSVCVWVWWSTDQEI